MKKTLPYIGAVKRGILIVALIGASSTELLAQGTSPWLQAIDVLQTAFTGPIARGLSLIAIVVGGLMFAFGEGGSKKALAGIVFGLGKAWRGYPALSKPLTIMGVERRWFLLSATFGLAMWNAINSIVTGGLIFGVLYGVGFWTWKQDPNMLEILRASAQFRARYDPGKWALAPWYLRFRQ